MQKRKRGESKKVSPYMEGMLIAILGFGIFMMFVCCIMSIVFIAVFKTDGTNYYEKYLETPVSQTTIDDLCSRNIVPESMRICNQP